MSADRIKGFDGIRGIAVTTVVFTHLGLYGQLVEAGIMPVSLLPIVHGGTGVFAFFVLSGFLITTLLIREQQTTGVISIKRFYARRALRIFPVYFAVLATAFGLAMVGAATIDWATFPFAATYTYNFIPRAAYSGLLGHTWTLAVEEHFYLIWPVIFLWGASRGYRILSAIAVAGFVASIVFRIALHSGALGALAESFFPDRWTLVAGGYIALGAALATMLHGKQGLRWRSVVGNPVCGCLGLALLAHTLFLDLEQFYLGTHTRCLGLCLIVGWIFCTQDGLVTRALETPLLRYIGRISYGIYMWQGVLLSTGPTRQPGVAWPLEPMLGLAMLIVIAPVSYELLEKPFLRLKDRYANRMILAVRK